MIPAATPMPVASNPPAASPAPTASAAPTATPAAVPAMQAQLLGSAGWTSPNGMTLYVFAADSPNVSNCNGACAAVWPPFMAAAGAAATGNFSVITRADGSHQWAFKSQPLYNFTGDLKPGDTSGNGLNQFGGIWTIARP